MEARELGAEDVRRGLPYSVGVGIRWRSDGGVPAVYPLEEESLGAHVAERRRLNFALGRAAARAALLDIGLAPTAIGRGAGGEPLWPAGIVGAISHTSEVAVALVGSARDYAGLGVDIEQLSRQLSARAARLVCTPEEMAWLAAAAGAGSSPNDTLPRGARQGATYAAGAGLADAGQVGTGLGDVEPGGSGLADAGQASGRAGEVERAGPGLVDVEPGGSGLADAGQASGRVGEVERAGAGWTDVETESSRRLMLLFSAKEAVFKALFPVEKVWLGFSDASLTWRSDRGVFEARLRKRAGAGFPIGAVLQVQCTVTPGLVLSTTYALAHSGGATGGQPDGGSSQMGGGGGPFDGRRGPSAG